MTFQSILKILLPECNIQQYSAQQILNDINKDSVRFLLKGSAKSFIKFEHKKSKELLLFDLGAGDLFGDISFFAGQKAETYDSYVKTNEICEVAEMPSEVFKGIILSSPQILWYFSKQIAMQLNNCKEKLISRNYSYSIRLKQLFLILMNKPDAMTHPDGIQIKISRKEIGLRLAISPFTVSKTLAELKNEKMIQFEDRSHNIVILR
ncbi:helix-turn-helix domain-containing protein [Psychromonas ossibalaenae]|uniref:helix-turn-helix domain-containing protein n=1 Tax=Psychromonas ossibalaenae TaxID=444922 RepID=UPI00037F7CB7|nr:helix-turn-helix domain-containing protein [Psychromonas ossibalaenae]